MALGLGFWQLDRAAQKTARHEAMVARDGEPVLDGGDLARSTGSVEMQRFRRAAVEGRWLADRTVFLDNRQMQGRVGFVVVTPLALAGSHRAVLVQRGFVPRRFDDRTALPAVPTPAGPVRVEATVDAAPSRLHEFDAAASGPIRQNLDLSAFARETGLDLLPVTLVERDTAGHAADGLARRWTPPTADVHKHHGYAFQWFMIAAVIVFLHVWFRFIQPRRRARR